VQIPAASGLCGDPDGLATGGHGSGGVIGVAADAELEAGPIPLGEFVNAVDKASRGADADDENAGRQRIERPGVADLRFAHKTADAIDDVARRHAGRFIEIKKTMPTLGIIAFPRWLSSVHGPLQLLSRVENRNRTGDIQNHKTNTELPATA
jgi:hypothetical protein